MSKSLNSDFINILDKLHFIMSYKGENMRARAYKQAQDSLIKYKLPIYDIKELDNIKGFGETIKKKFKEFMDTGTLSLIEQEKHNPIQLFTNVYGIGPNKAKQLVDKNITTIAQLCDNTELLNDTQKIGLQYYEDILKRIPRDEINMYNDTFDLIKKYLYIDKLEIVGSYRRGKLDSGDIDVIISDIDPSKFDKFILMLKEQNIILHTLTKGSVKSLTITQLPDKTPRRVDFMYSPPGEYPFATLYFTGSKEFNVVMRQHALDLGYTLNEHALCYMNNGVKGFSVDRLFNNELEIFNFLNLEWREPKDRIDANSLSIKNNTLPIPPKKFTIKIKNKTLKNTKFDIDHNIQLFKNKGIEHLNILSEKELTAIIKHSNDTYYNNNPIMTDNEHDIIKEYAENKFPHNISIKDIGAPISGDNKVNLPYFMASMDKIKPDTKALDNWKIKYTGPYVLTAKLDGISALYSTENNTKKLYTRGNGSIGQDISHLIPYLNLPNNDNITIRGELIMKKKTFIDKYKDTAANSRNLVSGIVNSKKSGTPEKYNDIDFICYEVIKPSIKPSEQTTFLDIFVCNQIHDNITNDYLSNLLITWRNDYDYDIDGIIVTNDNIYARTNKNPKHAFAFKMILSDQVVEAKVLDVLWTASKHGYLKPRIRVEPVIIGGATIEYATAFNAAYVKDNNIGIGTVVKLIRSGDVIPHIESVTTPSSLPKLPDVEYIWNDTNVDIIVKDLDNDQNVKIKQITDFFSMLSVDALGEGNIKRLVNAGFDSISKIIKIQKEDLLTVEGFKDKISDKILNSIQSKISSIKLDKLMGISNIFGRGFGEKRVSSILKDYPDILTLNISDDEKIDKILLINGFARKTAEKFVNNIPNFIKFINELGLEYLLNNTNNNNNIINHELSGKNIAITGFRNKSLEENLIKIGSNLATTINKNTYILLVKDINESTGKADKAKQLGIPIMHIDDFTKKYDL